jgi:hypothetical protein
MDLTQVEIAGPSRITYKGIDIGHTLKGVTLEVDRKFADVLVDRYGSMPVDKVLTGMTAKVMFELAQYSDRTMDIALPEGQNIDTATFDQTGIGADAGYALRGDAGLLVIHPLKYATGDQSHDVNIYLAVSTGKFTLPYLVDGQMVTAIEMEALVSEAYGTGRRLGHIGYTATS